MKDVYGEGSMPSKFPKEALDSRGDQRVPNGGKKVEREC